MYFILFEDEVRCFAVDESPDAEPISKEFHISSYFIFSFFVTIV
jgi:hypothetical protein